MDRETVNVVFVITKQNITKNIEVPLYITANELFIALNEAYDLKVDTSNIINCFFKAERPIALLRGNKTLAEFGVRNGTIIYFTE